MPQIISALPAKTGNMNNWLKTLAVADLALTPTFDPAVTGDYDLIVDAAITSITIAATPVASTSTVSGTGTFNLSPGANAFKISVTAENGAVRTYTLNIVRESAAAVTPTPTPAVTPAPTLAATPTPDVTPTVTPTATPQPTATPTSRPTTAPTPTPALSYVMSSRILVVSGNTVSGIQPDGKQNTTASVLASLDAPAGCTIRAYSSANTRLQDTDLVGTGCRFDILDNATVRRSYTALLYGDTSGDGKINSTDLNLLFKHILGKSTLSAPSQSAADADHNTKLNSADLNQIFKHVLKKLTISQN